MQPTYRHPRLPGGRSLGRALARLLPRAREYDPPPLPPGHFALLLTTAARPSSHSGYDYTVLTHGSNSPRITSSSYRGCTRPNGGSR